MIPIRCTQNPTSGEEYRRNWHPETISVKTSSDAVLIVGAGPAGLEAAMSLGRRGCRVVVADAADSPGGRVIMESRLPGLSAWKRVVDYRLGQIEKLDQVEIFLQSNLDKNQVLDFAKGTRYSARRHRHRPRNGMIRAWGATTIIRFPGMKMRSY